MSVSVFGGSKVVTIAYLPSRFAGIYDSSQRVTIVRVFSSSCRGVKVCAYKEVQDVAFQRSRVKVVHLL